MSQGLLFETDDVRITPYIGQFGATTYQIASIVSVRVVQLRRLNRIVVSAFFIGLALIVAAALITVPNTSFSVAVTGIGVIVAALLLQLFWPGVAFALVLKTSAGDVRALTSRKKQFIFNVREAIEQAFVARSSRSA
jgi:hypothetical protein